MTMLRLGRRLTLNRNRPPNWVGYIGFLFSLPHSRPLDDFERLFNAAVTDVAGTFHCSRLSAASYAGPSDMTGA